jgi:hypothetical protein
LALKKYKKPHSTPKIISRPQGKKSMSKCALPNNFSLGARGTREVFEDFYVSEKGGPVGQTPLLWS